MPRFSTIISLCFGASALLLAGCETTTPSSGGGGGVSGRGDAAPFLPGSSVAPFSTPGGGTPDRVFNVVFVADGDDYGDLGNPANLAAFEADVSSVINNGFEQVSAIYRNRTSFHYYVMRETGRMAGNNCPSSLQFPEAAITRDALFADAYLLLHKKPGIRDCYNGNLRASAGVRDVGGTLTREYGTAVHEMAHALFSLPDEYPNSGGYWETAPTGVIFTSQAECQSYVSTNIPEIPPATACTPLPIQGGAAMYRAEGFINDLMDHSSATSEDQLGPADWRKLERVVGEVSSGVNAPDVFAPAPWSRP